MKKITLTILAVLFIAACGNKGPLYLPESEKTEKAQKTETAEKKKTSY